MIASLTPIPLTTHPSHTTQTQDTRSLLHYYRDTFSMALPPLAEDLICEMLAANPNHRPTLARIRCVVRLVSVSRLSPSRLRLRVVLCVDPTASHTPHHPTQKQHSTAPWVQSVMGPEPYVVPGSPPPRQQPQQPQQPQQQLPVQPAVPLPPQQEQQGPQAALAVMAEAEADVAAAVEEIAAMEW